MGSSILKTSSFLDLICFVVFGRMHRLRLVLLSFVEQGSHANCAVAPQIYEASGLEVEGNPSCDKAPICRSMAGSRCFSERRRPSVELDPLFRSHSSTCLLCQSQPVLMHSQPSHRSLKSARSSLMIQEESV